MTADEMREQAKRLRHEANQVYDVNVVASTYWTDDLHAGADALEKLAAITEETTNHPEPECEKHPDGDVFKCGWKRAYTGVFNIATGKDQT